MPKPIPGESRDDFLLRCMGDAKLSKSYPEKDGRYAAVCAEWTKSGEPIAAKRSVDIYVPFQKTDDELRMVYGYCTSEAVDSQGEIVTKEAIRAAWEGYMEYGNIREMHQPSAVGVTKEYTHDDEGTWIGVKVVDDIAWTKVKEGVYKGFSIGGRVTKKSNNVIKGLILYEISLVDRPANPNAKFSAMKVDTGLVDQIELEVNSSTMKKFVEIDGVKYVEDPAKPGEALLDEASGEKVPYVEEAEPAAAEPEAPVAAEPVAAAPEAPVATEPEAPVAVDPKEAAAAVTLKKFKAPVAKDSMGVVTLASVLDHMTYVEEMFQMNGKDTTAMKGVIEEVKGMIAAEANEPDSLELSARNGDLAKALGGEFAKAIAPVMANMGALTKTVETLAADLAVMKGTKVSPRPVGSIAIEKSFDNGEGGDGKTVDALKAELAAVDKEINEFADTMKSDLPGNPGRSSEFMRKSAELHAKRVGIQSQLSAAVGL